jgi:hypothetical protein
MWEAVIIEAGLQWLGLFVAVTAGLIVSQVLLPAWAERRRHRRKAQQILREVDAALAEQAARAAVRARADLQAQVTQRRGWRP